MKTLVAFLVLLTSASSGLAQTLINRVDRQVGEPSRIEHRITSVPASAQQKSFEITLDKPSIRMGLVDYGTIGGHLKNLTQDTIQLIFIREQNRETNWIDGWTTSICFGLTCYTADKSSLSIDEAFKLPGGEQTDFKLAVSANNIPFDDSILVHVILAAVGSSEDDTVGLWMTAVASSSASVSKEGQVKRSTIRSIFPSPLMSGSSINVNVESVRETAYRYSIFDPFGREVAFGTSQRRLTAGTNQFNIGSLEGLNSGSYLLKLSFADGTSDAYPFTVLR